jgi:hypothetical protein
MLHDATKYGHKDVVELLNAECVDIHCLFQVLSFVEAGDWAFRK